MKLKIIALTVLGSVMLGACAGGGGASQPPEVSEADVAGSGVISSWRAQNEVTVIFQQSSTTQTRLFEEANRICGVSGQQATSMRNVDLGQSAQIPGVDGRVTFQCV